MKLKVPGSKLKPLVPLIALALVASGCGGSQAAAGQSKPMSHLTLWLDWTPWGVHVPIYAAESQGFFRKEDLDVSIRIPADVTDPLKLVASVPNTLGIGYMSDVVTAEAAGIPVESIAALVQHHLNCIMTLKSSGITSPTQLAGKSIGQGGTPADQVILDTVFKHAGVLGKVKLVNLYPYVPALLDGRVAAIEGAYQVWEKIQIEQAGQQVNVIQLQKWGVPDEYELVLLSSRGMVQHQPGVLTRFTRALDMGEAFAVKHPARATDDFFAANPENAKGKALVRESWRLLVPFVQPPGVIFGSQSPTRWQDLATWMYRNKLASKKVPDRDLFTDQFVG